jgi:hypothetical protein
MVFNAPTHKIVLVMICKNCGTPNKNGTKACIICNFPMDGGAITAPGQSAASQIELNAEQPRTRPNRLDRPRNSVSCPQCKYEIIKESDTCPMCAFSLSSGSSFPAPTAVHQPQPNGSVANQPLQYRGIPSYEGGLAPSASEKGREPEVIQLNVHKPASHPETLKEDHQTTEQVPSPSKSNLEKAISSMTDNKISVTGRAGDIDRQKNNKQEQLKQTQEPFRVNQSERALLFGTIDPFRKEEDQGSAVAYLEPVAREGEPLLEPVSITSPDNTIKVNRTSLDPENNTITSKVQAIFEYKDGVWYIVDQSEQQTTFVLVNQPTPIKNGDILLMGNRKFIFKC